MYAVNGSPAQTVVLAVLGIAPRRPSLVVSGINYGENLGTSVTGSGTVGAALQARGAGDSRRWRCRWRRTRRTTTTTAGTCSGAGRRISRDLLRGGCWRGQCPPDVDVLKVDVPADATPETPWRITRQAKQAYYKILPPAQRLTPGPLVAGLPDRDRLGDAGGGHGRVRVCPRPGGVGDAAEPGFDVADGFRGVGGGVTG